MKAAVVYESIYGNTRAIARAIAEGIGPDTMLVEVGEAAPDVVTGLDLLVVGGPTHVWSMSGRMSRSNARKRATGLIVSKGIGVREWLKRLPDMPSLSVAAFDTGIHSAGRFPTGSAATPIALNLRRKQARPIAAPNRFIVLGVDGPLAEGEVERAKRWGAELAQKATATPPQVAIPEPIGAWKFNRALGIFAAIVGLSAVAGGIALVTDVSGGNMGMPLDDLQGTPFSDYLIPGLLLLIVVGGSGLLAAFALLRRIPHGPEFLIGSGAIMVGWIAVQMTMIQFSWFQPTYIVIGLAMIASGWMARMLRGT